MVFSSLSFHLILFYVSSHRPPFFPAAAIPPPSENCWRGRQKLLLLLLRLYVAAFILTAAVHTSTTVNRLSSSTGLVAPFESRPSGRADLFLNRSLSLPLLTSIVSSRSKGSCDPVRVLCVLCRVCPRKFSWELLICLHFTFFNEFRVRCGSAAGIEIARYDDDDSLLCFRARLAKHSSLQTNRFGQMVTELITADSGKTKASPKPLKGAMKVIKKLKGRIGLGEFPIPSDWSVHILRFPAFRC